MIIVLRIEAGESLVHLADKIIKAFGYINPKDIAGETKKLKTSSDSLKSSVDQASK